MSDRRPRICIYCASRLGTEPSFADAARAVGTAMADREVDMVFGGGDVGLMGVVADAVLAGGRHVIGVMPAGLVDDEFPHRAVQDLRVVADMTERKRVMAAEADAFLALPGGIGTLEELFEMLSWAYLGLHDKPIGLLDVDGYFTHLVEFLDHSVRVGLTKPSARALLSVDDDIGALLDGLLREGV